MNSFFIHNIYDLEQLSVNADKRLYIDSADACVTVHTIYNYNGQHTNQDGIHPLWESKSLNL